MVIFGASTENHGLLHIQLNKENPNPFSISQLDTLNGLPTNSGNFAYMYQNELLFTSNEGLYQLANGSKDKVIPSTQLPKVPEEYQAIKHIVFGDRKVYISSNNGLTALDLSQENPSWIATPFKELNSILWKEYIDNDGIIWYNGNNGLIRYDSKKHKHYDLPYQTLIKQVNLNADSIIYYGNLTAESIGASQPTQAIISYGSNNIKFEYAAVSFDNNEQLEYQYFLKGFDEEFSSWSLETKKEYTNLPEGAYCFQVRAKNIFDHESELATYYFTIQTPWYRAWYAYILYALLIAFVIYTITKLNTKRLEKDKRKLERIVNERTAEIVTQNEELQQQQEEILAQRDHIEQQNSNLKAANQAISAQKEQIERSYNNINILSDIGREITSTLQTSEIIKMVYGHINQLMKAEAFGIGIYNPISQSIDFEGFIENEKEIPFSSDKLSDKDSLSVHCFLHKKDLIINDYAREYNKYIYTLKEDQVGEMPASIIYLPLLVENQAVGVITVQSFTKNAYTDNDKTVLSTLASYAAIAISNANSYEIIEQKNNNITASIRYAQTIQNAVLP